MNIKPQTQWRKAEVDNQPEETIQIEKKETERPEEDSSNKFSNSEILSGGLIPLTFTSLNEYGLTILSEKRSGEEEWESKYTIVPLSDQEYHLSDIDKNIFLKSKLKNRPSFLKLYLKRVNSEGGSSNSQLIIVKERSGQRKKVFQGYFNVGL